MSSDLRNYNRVTVGADGTIWATKTDFTVYKYSSSTWTQIPGACAREISANSIVAIITCTQTDSNGYNIAVYDSPSNSFLSTNGYGNAIAVGPANNIWYVNGGGEIFFSTDKGVNWDCYCQNGNKISRIFVSNSNVAFITTGFNLWKFNPTLNNFSMFSCNSFLFDSTPFFGKDDIARFLTCLYSGLLM